MIPDMFYALIISSIILVISYSACYRQLNFSKNISIVIADGLALLSYVFLLENPEILTETVTKIALLLIGAVIAIVSLIAKKAGT